ncbi:MAG: single-stranded DNA-binding protein [bacterium]|nr:single-stranded DNA-binding protein [bacterium]
MNATNRVQLTGNLGNDPEIKTFENGKLAKFSMATKEEYTTRSGEKASDTQWHFVIAWGKVAERVEADFKKGSFVSIEGKLVTRNYTDKNGQKKYVTEVVANDAVLNQKSA